MNTVTVTLNEEELKIFREYAKMNDTPLSTLFKQALEEKMENDIDLQVIQKYEQEGSSEPYTSHENLKKMLDF